MIKQWKEGDWCFYDYKLYQILEVKSDGSVRTISDGIFILSSSDFSDSCFPLNMENKRISDTFTYLYEKLRRETNGIKLNHANVQRYCIQQWLNAIKNKKSSYSIIRNFEDWCKEVINKANLLKDDYTIKGVKLF